MKTFLLLVILRPLGSNFHMAIFRLGPHTPVCISVTVLLLTRRPPAVPAALDLHPPESPSILVASTFTDREILSYSLTEIVQIYHQITLTEPVLTGGMVCVPAHQSPL